MKNKNTILMSFVALLNAMGVQAATWEKPTITGQAITPGETQYVFNVKANGFLNANGTKTTVIGDTGLPLYITANNNGTYQFGNTTDEGVTYTYLYYEDNQISRFGGEAGRTHLDWSVYDKGNGNYYIRPDENDENYGADYFPDMYMGWKNDATTTIYPLIDEVITEHGIVWKFVGEEEYTHYVSLKTLSDAMTRAEECMIDYASALSVYNNEKSTNAQLDSTSAVLKDLIFKYDVEHASLENPIDISRILANYSFEEGFIAGDPNIVGWTQVPAGSFTYSTDAIDTDGNTLGRWAFGDSKFADAKIYQTLTDAPNGKYELKVGYTCIDQEPANPESDGKDAEDYSVTGNNLYATTTLGTTTTNLASMSRWGTAEATITFFVTDGTLETGVEMKGSTANWFKLDKFQLTYYGNDAMKDQLQNMIDEAKAYTGGMHESYRTELDLVIKQAEDYIANGATVEEYTLKAEQLNQCLNEAKENGAMYASLQDTYEVADSILNTLEGEVNDDIIALSDYMSEIDIESVLKTYPYTTPELTDIIAQMDLLTQSAQHSLIAEGTDVTSFITNPAFEEKSNGWNIVADNEEALVFDNGVIAIDGTTCEVSQTLLGMPNGVYELTAQAFQRNDWNFENMDAAWAAGKKDSLIAMVTSYLFLNDGEKAVKHAFEDAINTDFTQDMANWDIRYGEKSGVMSPNTPNGAKLYFDKEAGYYKIALQAFVIDGKLTFGIRNHGPQGAHWGCVDNFKLNYVGKDLEKAVTLLNQKLESIEAYLEPKMNGAIKTKLQNAYKRGNELVNDPNADFDEVIDIIATISTVTVGIDESIEAFEKLNHANTVAAADLAIDGVAKTESGATLQALYDTNKAGYENEAEELTIEAIDNIAAQYIDLAMKAKIEKGIKNNADITYLLNNPSFEDQYGLGDGVNGVYNAPFGWTFMVDSIVCTKAEDMNKAGLNNFTSPDKNVMCTDGEWGYCMQTGSFPDVYMYQVVNGLPAGYYKVTVDLVVPNNNDDYRLAGQRLYVNDEAMYYGYEDEYDLDMLEAAHPYELNRTFGSFDEVNANDNGENGDKGPLNTLEVVVHVDENQPLKLGVRTDGDWSYTYKTVTAPEGWDNHGWCKFDNVRLSCVSLTGINDAKADGKTGVTAEEIYSVNGMRQQKLTKGVNLVRQTLKNGETKTVKVLVK